MHQSLRLLHQLNQGFHIPGLHGHGLNIQRLAQIADAPNIQILNALIVLVNALQNVNERRKIRNSRER